MLLREYLAQGWSKTALAEKLGISRRTVYYWLESGQLDRELDNEKVRYRSRPAVATKLEGYHGIVQDRLEEYPKLSAVRLFQELRKDGYAGSYTQVKEYVRRVRPVAGAEAVVRFETPPGRQAQVDFAHFRLPWGRRWALVVVLGYSRLLWVKFFERQTFHVLTTGLEEAFRYFGGVPLEVLFDQLKAVVVEDQRFEGGRLIENLEFLRFAAHWGFRARACRAYRAKTKGKVERPIRYLRENFFYGRQFLNDEDLARQLELWLEDVANARVHATTHEQPRALFERAEREALSPVAERPYQRLAMRPIGARPAALQRPALIKGIEVERRPLANYNALLGALS